MSSKGKLIESFRRILWLEEQMKKDYAYYKQSLSDDKILDTLSHIEADEIRHINMAKRIMTILGE